MSGCITAGVARLAKAEVSGVRSKGCSALGGTSATTVNTRAVVVVLLVRASGAAGAGDTVDNIGVIKDFIVRVLRRIETISFGKTLAITRVAIHVGALVIARGLWDTLGKGGTLIIRLAAVGSDAWIRGACAGKWRNTRTICLLIMGRCGSSSVGVLRIGRACSARLVTEHILVGVDTTDVTVAGAIVKGTRGAQARSNVRLGRGVIGGGCAASASSASGSAVSRGVFTGGTLCATFGIQSVPAGTEVAGQASATKGIAAPGVLVLREGATCSAFGKANVSLVSAYRACRAVIDVAGRGAIASGTLAITA